MREIWRGKPSRLTLPTKVYAQDRPAVILKFSASKQNKQNRKNFLIAPLSNKAARTDS